MKTARELWAIYAAAHANIDKDVSFDDLPPATRVRWYAVAAAVDEPPDPPLADVLRRLDAVEQQLRYLRPQPRTYPRRYL